MAVAIYGTLWVVPFAAIYAVSAANANFGADPVVWLEWAAGPAVRQQLWDTLGLSPDVKHLDAKTVSLLIAYIGSELIETPRMALSLLLAPRVKRALDARRAAKTAARAVAVEAPTAAGAPAAAARGGALR